MKKFIMVAVSALMLSACGVNGDQATRTLRSMGYTDIKIGGYAFFGCDKETFKSSFTATGVDGTKVSGVVCSDWFKGMTVRFD